MACCVLFYCVTFCLAVVALLTRLPDCPRALLRRYFHNPATGETQWTVPATLPLPVDNPTAIAIPDADAVDAAAATTTDIALPARPVDPRGLG